MSHAVFAFKDTVNILALLAADSFKHMVVLAFAWGLNDHSYFRVPPPHHEDNWQLHAADTRLCPALPCPASTAAAPIHHCTPFTPHQALVSPSVSPPGRAIAFAPFIVTLKAVKVLLDALQAAIVGPAGTVVNALDGANAAATALLGGSGPAANIAGLITKALGLLAKVPGL